jgi:hypothetical protein
MSKQPGKPCQDSLWQGKSVTFDIVTIEQQPKQPSVTKVFSTYTWFFCFHYTIVLANESPE